MYQFYLLRTSLIFVGEKKIVYVVYLGKNRKKMLFYYKSLWRSYGRKRTEKKSKRKYTSSFFQLTKQEEIFSCDIASVLIQIERSITNHIECRRQSKSFIDSKNKILRY